VRHYPLRRRAFGSGAFPSPLAIGTVSPFECALHIGVLLIAGFLRGFRQGLKEVGYIEGQNLAVEYRWAQQNDQLPFLATDLVGRQLSVLVAQSTPHALALLTATSTIPIVFARK
jgi:hypothetical protein